MAQTNFKNKYGHSAENTHLCIIDGDLGRPLAVCSEKGIHASESTPAMLRSDRTSHHCTHELCAPQPPILPASFLPYAGCAFSVLDDLSPCLGVIKDICVLWCFWKGKETFLNRRKPENVHAFTELTRPALQCAVPVFMCEIHLHSKIF